MNYTNREVVRRLKQYDMFFNSLELTDDEVQRERICDQLDKIEKQILLETNGEYEEEYMILLSKEAKFFSEEKAKLRSIIALIEDRKKYLADRKIKHKKITGSLVELTTFLGEDKLLDFKNRLRIIEKYEKNKTEQEQIIREMKSLDIKISEASRSVKANTRLNDSLEHKMIEKVERALKKLELYSLADKRNEITSKHESLKYALNLAKDNLKSARSVGDPSLILECDSMLSEITTEYYKYNESLNILKLIDIYDETAITYDDLLSKRERIDDILKNITESELYKEINDELSKQYNTIKLESHDIETYDALKKERETKNNILYELDEENNSKEFKSVLSELIRNEERIKEEQIRIARRNEYNERQKKLQEEQKIEASRVRRQKLIEEAKLKEQLETTERLKKLQEKTVLSSVGIEEKKEETTLNPLKGKSFDDIVLSNDFDTDELFGKTKIVPNRSEIKVPNIEYEKGSTDEINNDENLKPVIEDVFSLNDKPQEELIKSNLIEHQENIPEEKEVADLFKEEDNMLEISSDNVAEKKSKNTGDSIYDILENNKDIYWKTADNSKEINNNSIPIIGNNNLKPEILGSSKVDEVSFPELNKEEGEVLWKETM